MRRDLLLYPGHTEPVETPAPPPAAPELSWGPQYPDRIHGLARSEAALQARAVLGVPEEILAEPILPDKYWRVTDNPRLVQRSEAALQARTVWGLPEALQPETVFPDKYWRQPSERLHARPYWLATYDAKEAARGVPEELQPETIFPDKYWRQPSERLFPKPWWLAVYEAGMADRGVPESLQPEDIFPDKYWRNNDNPRLVQRSLGALEARHVWPLIFPDLPIPELSWWRPASEPLHALPRREAALIAQNLLTLALAEYPIPELAWFQPASERLHARPWRLAAMVAETRLAWAVPDWPVPELSWFQPASERLHARPRRLAALVADSHIVLALPDFPVPDLSWFQPVSERQHALPRRLAALVAEARLAWAVPDWPVPDLSWWRPASEPPPPPRRSLAALVAGFLATFNPDDFPSPLPDLAWQGRYPDRIDALRRSLAALEARAVLGLPDDLLPETIYPDKYWRNVDNPVLVRRSLAAILARDLLVYALPDLPVPDLSWHAIPGLPDRAAILVPWHEARPDPVEAAVPELSWHAWAAMPGRAFLLLPWRETRPDPIEAPAPDLIWQQQGELLIPRQRRPMPEPFRVEALAQLPIPDLSWRGVWPDWLPPPERPPYYHDNRVELEILVPDFSWWQPASEPDFSHLKKRQWLVYIWYRVTADVALLIPWEAIPEGCGPDWNLPEWTLAPRPTLTPLAPDANRRSDWQL